MLQLLIVFAAFLQASPQIAATAPEANMTHVASTADSSRAMTPRYAPNGEFVVAKKQFDMRVDGDVVHITALYPVAGATVTVSQKRPYPLVIFSPGLGSTPEPYLRLLEPIASHGFVVLAWTPRGESGPEFWERAATRTLDLQRILSHAEAFNAANGELAGLIDTAPIAVVGHSSGGWTALLGGGAQMDLGACAHPTTTSQTDGNCPQFLPHQADIARMLHLPAVPTGPWPAIRDPRVKAVIAMSPDGDIWGVDDASLATMQVPTMIMAGSDDHANVPAQCAYPMYRRLGSRDKSLVVFEHGDHDLGWGTYSESIKHLMTAFLLARLKGDMDAAAALLPSAVVFQGVRYEHARVQ